MVTPRRRLLSLLAVVCLLPVVALVTTWHRLPHLVARSSSLAPLSPPPSTATSTTMSAKSAVEQKISNGHVVVFSKSYCPYCRNAKQLLKSLDVEADVYELDQMSEGADWQDYLAEKTGQRTVPNIFIDGTHVGGSSDLEAKNRSGELKKLLGAKA
ncbi:hypothetical protein JCM10212_004598 [Sporobolomyces blumeae]